MGQITGITGIKTESGVTPKSILFAPDMAVAVPVIIANTGIVADGNGKKILKAGAPLYGSLTDRATAFVKSTVGETTSNAVGILLHETDVTDGNVNAQCLIFGFVDESHVETGVIDAKDVTALAGKVTFIK